ncbi:hypothetical protein L6164_019948 [Bauhinia variegata]|uniref:Uncharacterized protein n=1 Tax=Bauhinia variegata TaxID=167791 RepID=A0ACB9MWX4_BAUVA|nr:hypothetical protein L6164_019948 [Bauhinia variegata]
MIQELLGGAGFVPGERKFSINGGVLAPTPSPNSFPSSPCPNSSTTSSSTTNSISATSTTATSSNSDNQNLRCPRCDSSNTKFCYYNNYNLTQPRHFCKTCRRYWTKGGALRNVPIGGGCRKNKNVGISNTVAKASVAKVKTVASELGRSGIGGGFDHELPSSPVLWGSPQNSHLLALLRAGQNQNPNPNPSLLSNGIAVKEEGHLMGTQMVMTEPLVANGVLLNARALDFDPIGQVPSLGLCSSFWRNNQDQPQQQNGNFVLGEPQNSGIQELCQRLRSSSTNYCGESPTMFLGNVTSSSSSSSSLSILESAPVAGGELGYWNSTFSWSDLPTTNGAYP